MSTRKPLEHTPQVNFETQAFFNGETFLDSYNNCSLCGEPLQFNHKLDGDNLQVAEESYCPNCHIRTKAQYFPLH